MTSREVFDKVKAHLLKQGVKSTDPVTGECLYRGPNGTKCAVGCLIPDDKYNESMESHNVYGLDLKSLDLDGHLELLKKLQSIHDFRSPNIWAKELDELEETLDKPRSV